MMALADAYCRVNRARGLELLSPEDLLNASRQLALLDLPLVLRIFDSGVMVLQARSHDDNSVVETIAELVNFIFFPSFFHRSKSIQNIGIFHKGFFILCSNTQLKTKEFITAEELAQSEGISVLLAREKLLVTEKYGRACRDDTIESLRFYPNLFLQEEV